MIALGIVAAPVLSLMVVPLAFAGTRGAHSGCSSDRTAERGQAEFTLAPGGGFAAAVLLIMFSEQTFLNAGPLLVRATEGAAAAGFIFNVLMLARAPLVSSSRPSRRASSPTSPACSRAPRRAARRFRLSVRLTIARDRRLRRPARARGADRRARS